MLIYFYTQVKEKMYILLYLQNNPSYFSEARLRIPMYKADSFRIDPQRTPRKGNFDMHITLNENKRDREEAYSSYH